MELLVGFTCLSILSVALIVKVMLLVTDKSAAGAITQHFQAAEYILEHHQPPPAWSNPSSGLSLFKFFQKSQPSDHNNSTLLERLDHLIRFFEHSQFFQTEDARTALLDQLNNERTNWIQRYQ